MGFKLGSHLFSFGLFHNASPVATGPSFEVTDDLTVCVCVGK